MRQSTLWYVFYRKTDGDIGLGQLKGRISTIRRTSRRGDKEQEFGMSCVAENVRLFNDLLTGEVTVDVERSTPTQLVTCQKPDGKRRGAVKIARVGDQAPFQSTASEKQLRAYVSSFLEEITRRIRHVPLQRQVEIFPDALLMPASCDVLVARDGVAFVYSAPHRPESCEIKIDSSAILDSLLLPHPPGMGYVSHGPEIVGDQDNTEHGPRYYVGVEEGAHIAAPMANPIFVITERRWHRQFANITFIREYPDGSSVNQYFQFSEIFGDTSTSNFTRDLAEERARKFVQRRALAQITRGQVDSMDRLASIVRKLRELVSRNGTTEPDIEKHLDQHPWLLERGLGYKRFHSQVKINAKLLANADVGIRPDKFVERHDGICDILDLKRADAKLVVGKTNRSRESASLSEAQAQVDTYCRLVAEPAVKEYLFTQGITIHVPGGVVIAGRRPTNTHVWEEVKRRLTIRVYTYDDLLEELETILAWVSQL